MICRNCGIKLNEVTNYCFNCGEKVELLMDCPECNGMMVKGANFCSDCGTSIVKQPKEEKSTPTFLQDIDIEKQAQKWYGQYFEYVGDFVDGFAPVIDSLSNPGKAGYVTLDIPEKLSNYVKKKNAQNLSAEEYGVILYHFKVNRHFGGKYFVWAGKFSNGNALIATKDHFHSIDEEGNIKEFGTIRSRWNNNLKKAIVVWKVHEFGGDCCIIDFEGNFIRNNEELIHPLWDCEDIAQFVNPRKGKFGLLRISNGQEILQPKYEFFEEEECTLLDGTKINAIITQRITSKGSLIKGLYDIKNGWIFKTKYPIIKVIRDESYCWKDGFVLVCHNIDENEICSIAITDMAGRTLYEYTSCSSQYAVIDGKPCVFIENNDGVDVVGIDNKLVVSFPGARNVEYMGEKYFLVTNSNGQQGVMDADFEEYTIPFGRFDQIWSHIVNGAIKVMKNKLWGFVGPEGEVLIPLMYKNIANEFSLEERAEICVYPDLEGSSWFYINYKNETDGGIPARQYIKELIEKS